MAATASAAPEGRPWLRHYPPGVRTQVTIPEVPMYQLFYERARKHPDRTALVYFGTRISYGRLAGLCDRFAGWLRGLGVRPGDRVGIMLPNCPQIVVAIIGSQRAGAIPSLFNPLYVPREIEHQARDSGVRLFLTLDLLAARAGPALVAAGVHQLALTRVQEYFPFPLKQLFPLKLRREGTRVELPAAPPAVWWQDGMGRSYPPLEPPPVDPRRDVAVLFYTGGTTGVSKGVACSHYNILANVMQVREFVRRPDDPERAEVTINVMPIFHAYGFINCVSYGLSWGHTAVLLPRFDPKQVLQVIQKYRPTAFPGVPTLYIGLLRQPDLAKYDLKSIDYCLSAAAPMPGELMTAFEQATGGKILEGYGLTEASAATHLHPIAGARKPGTVGIPLPGVDCRIVDLVTGADLGPGREGEVVLRGPNVALGYWNRPDETAETFRDGWLYTGDIGVMDEDGYLTIVDRKKDMVIAGGYNIYPREIDEVLYQHPKVQEACAVGVPDAYRGETIKAFVVLKPGETATADEIVAWCRQHLAAYKAPRLVEFVPDLPKSAIGKVLRRVLAQQEREKGGTG